MFNLLKVEFYKLTRFKFGYIAVLFMFVVGYVYGDNRIGNRMFDMADNTAVLFSSIVHDTSFVFFIAIVMALFMGKDFSNRTICNEVKLGYRRLHILLSRAVVVCAFAVLLHVIYVVSAVIGFSMVRGFDTSLLCTENILWFLTVSLQLAAVISGVVLLSFTAQKVSEAIAFSVMYAFICCNILRNFISAKVFMLSCFCFVQTGSKGNLGIAVVSALITMTLFLTITAFTFNKIDIK